MLKVFLILLITYQSRANDFIVVPNQQGFFQPCDSSDNHGNTEMTDFAEINVHHEYAEDMETLITNGNVTIKEYISEAMPIQLILEILKWHRGNWELTVFSLRRPDFCKVVFDPSEFWYELSMQIPEEYRICPPKKNTVYQIENMENRIKFSNVHGLDLEGEYKVIVHFIEGPYTTCITSIVNIWKD